MKKIVKKSFVKKTLIALGLIIIGILLLDYLIMPWYVSSPETSVPNVLGLKEAAAIEKLEDADFKVLIADTSFSDKYKAGLVFLQKPNAGSIVKEGRLIYLFVSGGEPEVNVPRLIGRSIRDAKFALEKIGLKLGVVDEISSTNPKEMIFDQQFAEGTPLKRGSSVNITISAGNVDGQIEVPDLIGKSLTEATMILRDSSLVVGKINYQRSFSLLPNTVLDQYPSKGNKLNQGDKVDLFVTKASESGSGDEIKEE